MKRRVNGKGIMNILRMVIISAIILTNRVISAYAEPGSSIEEKTKYERIIEQKIGQVLEDLLGPGKAKVMVNIEVDFSQMEKLSIKSSTGTEKWLLSESDSGANDMYLMPGFVLPDMQQKLMPNKNQNVERSIEFASRVVKKMAVSIVVDDRVSPELLAFVRSTITTLLSLDEKRGDSLTIMAAHFNSPLENIIARPESMAYALKYLSVAFIVLICLMTFSYCAVKLANAVVASSMSKQTQELTMDVFDQNVSKGSTALSGGVAALPGGKPGEEGVKNAAKKEGEGGESKSSNGELIKAEYEKYVPIVLKDESADTIAVIMPALSQNLSSQVFSGLSEEKQAEVILLMSQENGSHTKEEKIKKAEEVLKGLVESQIEMLSSLSKTLMRCSENVQKTVLDQLSAQNPHLAEMIPSFLVRYEDLIKLNREDMNLLLSSMDMEQFSLSLKDMPEEFVGKVKEQLHEETQKVLSEYLRLGSPQAAAKVMEARVSIAEKLYELRAGGRINF